MRLLFATARRVLQQLAHDHRTLALLFVVPCMLLGLLAWIYSEGNGRMFNTLGPSFLAIFPFIILFIVTSVTMLRERSGGTLERLLALPISKGALVGGYALAFGVLAVVQSAIASSFAVYVLGLDIAGPQWFMMLVAVADALLGMALGLLVSAFARSEFQAVQFMPAFVFPQLLLGGLLVPVGQLPAILEVVARCLPLTYAIDAIGLASVQATPSATAYTDLAVVAAFAIAAVMLGALTLRRQS